MVKRREVLLVGFAGAGKDSVRRILESKHGFQGAAFAEKVRELATIINPFFLGPGCHYNDLIASLGYEAAKREHRCIRDFLVKIGHDCKQVLGENVWIELLKRRLDDLSQQPVCVSDCRYLSEVLAFPDAEVWYIERAGVGPANDKEAESIPKILEIAGTRVVVLRNSGSLQHLEAMVDDCVSGNILLYAGRV